MINKVSLINYQTNGIKTCNKNNKRDINFGGRYLLISKTSGLVGNVEEFIARAIYDNHEISSLIDSKHPKKLLRRILFLGTDGVNKVSIDGVPYGEGLAIYTKRDANKIACAKTEEARRQIIENPAKRAILIPIEPTTTIEGITTFIRNYLFKDLGIRNPFVLIKEEGGVKEYQSFKNFMEYRDISPDADINQVFKF
ncbi:MAG: hypothetical protein WCY19_01210 [Candidatus Gastranaerophilaceae bacterium]